MLKVTLMLVATSFMFGCTTMKFTSQKPPNVVAECIAAGWRGVPVSGIKIPVTVTNTPDYYFVEIILVRDFPTGIPLHSAWAKVRSNPPGDINISNTEYRCFFQLTHKRLDRVVVECQ